MKKAKRRRSDALRPSYRREDFPKGFVRGKYATRSVGRRSTIRSKKRRAADPQQREETSRRTHLAHGQRIARRAKSALTLIRLEKRALLGRTEWMHIPNPPQGWDAFIERLAKADGTLRFAEWWRNWILALNPKTCSVDEHNYAPLLVDLSLMGCTRLFEGQSWAHDWLARQDKQRDLIEKLRAHLRTAREVSEHVRLYFPVFKRRRSYDENPIRDSIVEALEELERRAQLFGYTKPVGTTVGRRGKAAADSRAAARGYIVRDLASFIRVAPKAIREAFITDVLDCAGYGTKATRQNVQAILRAARF
jgi:hypothetical protein